MRQVNQLARALARALSLRSENRQAEVVAELDRAMEDFLGTSDPRPEEDLDLLQLCVGPDGEIRPFAFDIAGILTLKGDVLSESGKINQASELYVRALTLYDRALKTPGATLPWNIHELVDGLKERLQDVDFDTGSDY